MAGGKIVNLTAEDETGIYKLTVPADEVGSFKITFADDSGISHTTPDIYVGEMAAQIETKLNAIAGTGTNIAVTKAGAEHFIVDFTGTLGAISLDTMEVDHSSLIHDTVTVTETVQVTETIKGQDISGSRKYLAGVKVGTNIYFAPYHQNKVGVLDTSDTSTEYPHGTFSTIDTNLPGGAGYVDAVAVGTKIYFVPSSQSVNIGVVDTTTTTFSTIPTGLTGDTHFRGAAVANSKVYFVTEERGKVHVLNPSDTAAGSLPHGTFSTISVSSQVDGTPIEESSTPIQSGASVTDVELSPTSSFETGKALQGILNELKMFDRVLSPDQIREEMKLTTQGGVARSGDNNVNSREVFASESPNLLGYWSLNDGFGAIARDRGPSGRTGILGEGMSDRFPAWKSWPMPYKLGDDGAYEFSFHVTDNSDGIANLPMQVNNLAPTPVISVKDVRNRVTNPFHYHSLSFDVSTITLQHKST